MIFLRQSTASQEIPLGRFVDSADGNTEKTALTIANTDIKLWKTGAVALVSKNSGGATHMAGGEYYTVLDATDSDTIGPMKVGVHVSGALAVQVWCVVLDEAVYDVLFGTAAPITSAGAIAATAPTVDSSGDFTLVIGDDYLTANSRSLDFSYAATDLTGFTPILSIKQPAGAAAYVAVTGTIVNPGASNQLLRFELSAATSATLQDGERDYQIHCTSGAGKKYPSILGGTATVTARIGA